MYLRLNNLYFSCLKSRFTEGSTLPDGVVDGMPKYCRKQGDVGLSPAQGYTSINIIFLDE